MAPEHGPSREQRGASAAAGTRMPFARRAAAVLVLAWALALVRTGPAAAHSETVESKPAPGEAVLPSPTMVSVRYTDPLGPESTISVVDDAFAEVTEGPTRVDADDPHAMSVALLHDLPLGAYTVAWTAHDAADGHKTSGSYTFSVGDVAATSRPSGQPSGTAGQTILVLVVLTVAVLGVATVARRRARPTPTAMLAALAFATAVAGVAAGCSGASTAGPTAPSAAVTDGAQAASSAGDGPTAASSTAAADDPGGVPIQISIAASDLAVGEDRFAFAILGVDNALIPDVDATATFFRLEGEAAEETGTVPATYYASRLPEAGTYVALTRFDRAGPWGVQISGTLPDGRAVAPNRVRFEVASRPRSPAVGDMAPPTANRTLATVPDIAALTSDPMPDRALYAMTVDEAVASGKPTVVVFATPGYCESRICTPVIDEVKAVAAAWRGRVNFIHLEVYKSFNPPVLADEMEAWGLETEPWTFVLTADGHVAARLEGNATQAELVPLLERVTGGG